MPNLTTTQAAALLSERGKAVKADTVKHWCQQGRFPNAKRVGGTRRGYWLVPKADLEAFELPKVGNPGK